MQWGYSSGHAIDDETVHYAMRINHVRALLSDTDKSILDIALTVGFRSSSRFYSTFGKYVGMSPQQYRKLSRQRRQTFPG